LTKLINKLLAEERKIIIKKMIKTTKINNSHQSFQENAEAVLAAEDAEDISQSFIKRKQLSK